MTERITWSSAALTDLVNLFDWIAERAGIDTAEDYTIQIEAHVDKLLIFPNRGTPRDDLQPGLRSIVYRKRTIVFYRTDETQIEIIHIAHGGRDLTQMFPRDE